MTQVTGQCHCGNLSFRLTIADSVDHLVLYGCSCSYCRLLGASWLGDPATELCLAAEEPNLSHWYTTGPATLSYLICSRCGITVASVCPIDGRWYGIVNAKAAVLPALPQDFLALKPEALTDQQRLVLRKQRYVKDVQFQGGLAPPEPPIANIIAAASTA